MSKRLLITGSVHVERKDLTSISQKDAGFDLGTGDKKGSCDRTVNTSA